MVTPEDYFTWETKHLKEKFTINYMNFILDFQDNHSIEIIRLPDFQYACHVDGKIYDTSLTPMYALFMGVYKYCITHNIS